MSVSDIIFNQMFAFKTIAQHKTENTFPRRVVSRERECVVISALTAAPATHVLDKQSISRPQDLDQLLSLVNHYEG